MPRGNRKFTDRLNNAIDLLMKSRSDLQFLKPRSRSLFSPVLRSGKYVWVKVMDSDGTLIARRMVEQDGEGAVPAEPVDLLIGIVLQCEDSTSQTKPNPIGKASIDHIPTGIWVDLERDGRRRLDLVYILFIVPKGARPKDRAKFSTAKRNSANAAELMPNCDCLEVKRQVSAKELAAMIRKQVRKRFRGRGRPRK